MMKIGFQKKQKVVAGLDIGTRCVKLVCLDHGADEYRLHSFGIEELQPDAILAGEVRDREGVIRSVRSLIDQTGLPLRDVVISLSGNEVLSETLTIGLEFDGKSDEVVRAEAERINPFDFDIGSVTLDYKTLEKEPQADGNPGAGGPGDQGARTVRSSCSDLGGNVGVQGSDSLQGDSHPRADHG